MMDVRLVGKRPINPDYPTGTDVRYEPEFEQLQAEIDKLSSPSAEGSIDWKRVVKLAAQILGEKSKDLLVASYLAVAQIYTDGIDGLDIGSGVYLDVLTQYWDDLYPTKKRMKGRLGAIEWWVERTKAALETLQTRTTEPKTIGHIKENLEQIEKLLVKYLDESLSLGDIRKLIDNIHILSEGQQAAKPEDQTESRQQTSKPIAQKQPQITSSVGVEEIQNNTDAQRILKSGIKRIRQAVAYLGREDRSNPRVYRWTRIAMWSEVDKLPLATDGKTRIPPPLSVSQFRSALDKLGERGDWGNLLESAESKMFESEFVFWLDLNRYSSEALSHLGERFHNADEVVRRETAFFIYRLPGLENLAFSDGTPFADTETKRWLRRISFDPGTSTAETLPSFQSTSPAHDNEKMAEEIARAHTLMREEKIADALDHLQQHIRACVSKREAMVWRLALIQILADSKRPTLALPHLEKIFLDIETYGLEDWDPEFAVELLRKIWLSLNAHPDKDLKGKAIEILNRIAKVDPIEAVRLGGL